MLAREVPVRTIADVRRQRSTVLAVNTAVGVVALIVGFVAMHEHEAALDARIGVFGHDMTIIPRVFEIHNDWAEPPLKTVSNNALTVNGRLVIQGKCGDFVIDMDHNTTYRDLNNARRTSDKDCQ